MTPNEPKETIISLMHKQRKFYEEQQKKHYFHFAAFTLILLLDFIIIIFTRAITLNAYAWAGIIFLFVLIGVSAKQHNEFKALKESVDDLYLRGEYCGPKDL